LQQKLNFHDRSDIVVIIVVYSDVEAESISMAMPMLPMLLMLVM
jgi:hypothetical protein